MTDYSKMKNAELEALLKSRNLPHTGKKADMVQRLQDADKKPPTIETPAISASAATEDEIDWDDDSTDAPSKPAEPEPPTTSEPAAAAIAAGGQGQVANPQAVPNQVADIDPAKTDDLSVKQPAEEQSAEPTAEEAKVEEKLKVDFTRGLAKTTLDEEIEKRKKRAAKFGIAISEDEELKKLERAKKFGETDGPKGINEALPERPLGRKRGREGEDEGRRGGDKRRGGRNEGRSGRGARGGDRGGDRKPPSEKRERRASPSGGPKWMSEADRAKAEARKAKFGAPAA
jgi:SAP domain-containing ribonucleoprotein